VAEISVRVINIFYEIIVTNCLQMRLIVKYIFKEDTLQILTQTIYCKDKNL